MKQFLRKAPVLTANLLIAAAVAAAIVSGKIPGWTIPRISQASPQPSSSEQGSETSASASSETVLQGTGSDASSGTTSGPENASSAGPEAASSSAESLAASSSASSPETSSRSPASPPDSAYFDDALFVGDSVTEGQKLYGDLDNAHYFCRVGLTIYQLFEEPKSDEDSGLTLRETLRKRNYGKIFLLLGLNEMGTGTTDYFVRHYSSAVAEIQRLRPDAKIFVEAILPVTKEKSDGDAVFSNPRIRERNAGLKALAAEKKVYFLDLSPAVSDDEGNLRAEFSGDGVHIKARYWDSVCDAVRAGAAQLDGA